MSYEEWKDRTDSFKKVDVRGIQRGEICTMLKEKLGEKNPDVKV